VSSRRESRHQRRSRLRGRGLRWGVWGCWPVPTGRLQDSERSPGHKSMYVNLNSCEKASDSGQFPENFVYEESWNCSHGKNSTAANDTSAAVLPWVSGHCSRCPCGVGVYRHRHTEYTRYWYLAGLILADSIGYEALILFGSVMNTQKFWSIARWQAWQK